tara:strand:- start:516 stop:1460 length:945 start_codon:yes stop_codon:yes gene_type:complete
MKNLFKFKITAAEERQWEKNHILNLKDDYLNTDTLIKYKNDLGYKLKIDLIKNFLDKNKTDGYILDIGSNTCGEPEILNHYGHRMVSTDINEIALSLSKKRSLKYRNQNMDYFAIDAHNIPFQSETFDKITAIEVLHHLENLNLSLIEMFRVLKKGGLLFTYEPYALNPYRRLSEIRDYFRGTIEKSFYINQIKKNFVNAGFEIVDLSMISLPISTTKIKNANFIRKITKTLYSKLSQKYPSIFGMIVLIAKKPGEFDNTYENIYENIICPETKNKIFIDKNFCVTKNSDSNIISKYPIYEGVPVLIKEDKLKS